MLWLLSAVNSSWDSESDSQRAALSESAEGAVNAMAAVGGRRSNRDSARRNQAEMILDSDHDDRDRISESDATRASYRGEREFCVGTTSRMREPGPCRASRDTSGTDPEGTGRARVPSLRTR
jgi:hypothetical protein